METLHPSEIDLGLSRVEQVAATLNIAKTRAKVITVAGTNGKGSCVATLEKLLSDNQYQVGTYTSPHVTRYNERIKLLQREIDDQILCDTFALIDEARGTISLTYFEFATLAALYIFSQSSLDYWILEVGLGGRLDAVNIIAPDVAVITSIDLDHEAWLGDTREKIAAEKLGILRPRVACVCAEPNPTSNMYDIFDTMQVKPMSINHDFSVTLEAGSSRVCFDISIDGQDVGKIFLERPNLPLNSVAAALQVLSLCDALPSNDSIAQSLSTLALFGRFETIERDSRRIILDVAHNPAAGQLLADNLKRVTFAPADGRYSAKPVLAVVGMMADKNIAHTLSPLCPLVDEWFTCEFDGMTRTAKSEELANILVNLGVNDQNVLQCQNVGEAMASAWQRTQQSTLSADQECATMLVFGSFITVSFAHEFLKTV